MYESFVNRIEEIGCPYLENAPLGKYSSIQVGGTCRYAVWPENTDQIKKLIASAKEVDMPYYILGNCTNILVPDDGVNGLIILLGKSGTNFHQISLIDDTTIHCEAGVSLQEVCMFALKHGLKGLEFAYGIPASIGGAIYMNAGAFEGEIKDVVTECTFIDEDGNLVTFLNPDLKFSYRHSYFHDHSCVIISANIHLEKGNREEIKEKMDTFLNRRIAKQPLEYPSAGSTFKRPGGAYAAKLIDDSGLKGYTVGGAMVSNKHCGFVINYDNATSKDVIALVEHIQKVVAEKTGYHLECEMIIM